MSDPKYSPWILCAGGHCGQKVHEDDAHFFDGDPYCESCWEDLEPRLMGDLADEMAETLPGINWESLKGLKSTL